MNISKILWMCAFVGLGLTSCDNEEFPNESSRQGSMSLNVDRQLPKSMRAVETADFPVTIYSVTENKEFATYERADQVPNQIKMPVGNYYAEAHTPGVFEKIMNADRKSVV